MQYNSAVSFKVYILQKWVYVSAERQQNDIHSNINNNGQNKEGTYVSFNSSMKIQIMVYSHGLSYKAIK